MEHGFQLVETSIGPPLKHDMFPCRFAPGPLLPMHGNMCWAALKRTIHLQLDGEITSRRP